MARKISLDYFIFSLPMREKVHIFSPRRIRLGDIKENFHVRKGSLTRPISHVRQQGTKSFPKFFFVLISLTFGLLAICFNFKERLILNLHNGSFSIYKWNLILYIQ